MTHVVTLQELKKLIPEIKELEGMNFKGDIKFFLITVIKIIEKSEKWKFVQYLQPVGIFVVREVPVQHETLDPILKMERPYIPQENISKPKVDIPDKEKIKTKNVETILEDKKIKENAKFEPTNNDKLFTDFKLPW
jgi:hypothetical protein